MRDNKGITIITLIVTVAILIIITGVTISVSTTIVDLTKFENVKTDLLLIQSKAKVLADQKAIGEIEEEGLYGTKQIGGEYDGWYLLSQTDLDNMGIKEADASDNYYVDYENEDVAMEIGIEYKGIIYYKLSDIMESGV